MLRTFWSKVTALLRGRRSLREDLRADMDAHLELDVEARVQGGTPEETTRSAAVRAFCNRTLIRETSSEAWTFRAVETFVQDVRLGLRAMTHEPGLATAVVLSLGIGIGASTAVFRVVDALVFRDLAVEDPAGLLVFRRSYAGDGRAPYGFDYSWFERYQRLDDVFAGVAAVHVLERADLTAPMSNGSGPVVGDPQVRVSAVTGNYFSVLGARMHVGRALSDVDDGPEERPVAVISNRYWQRRFNREPDVLGRPVTINGTPFSILGVAERGFSGEWLGRPTDVWVPVSSLPRAVSELPPGNRRGGGLAFRLLGRLRPGVSIEQARSRGQVVYQRILHEERAGRSATTEQLARIARARFDMEPAAKGFSPQRASHWPPLALLGGMTGLVLLLACANAAGLLLARLAERRGELSIRVAIGAGPLRLAHQLLAESLALSVCATAVGLLLSHWGTRLLAAWISTGPASGVAEQLTLDLQPDERLIVFSGALCLLTVVGVGVGPAAMAARSRAASGARQGLTSFARVPGGRALVIAQLSLSVVLGIGAAGFVQALRSLEDRDLGLDREHVLLLWASPRQAGMLGDRAAALYDTVRARLALLPDVVEVGVASDGVLDGGRSEDSGQRVSVPGRAAPPGEVVRANSDVVTPGYLGALGLRLLQGRDVEASDSGMPHPVVIISESVVRRFFPDTDPIGRLITFEDSSAPHEIIGVVSDARYRSPFATNRMMFYVPYHQEAGHLFGMCIALRTSGDPLRLARQAREALREAAPELPVLRVGTVEDQVADVLAPERMMASLSLFFGATAALLGCLGLYALLAYTTRNRTNEIALRLALGSSRIRVMRMVLRDCLRLVVTGVAIGLAAATGAARAARSVLPDAPSADLPVVTVAILLLSAVALLAGLLPAWRGSRLEPMAVLRSE